VVKRPGFEGNGIAYYSEEISQMNDARLHIWRYVGKNTSQLLQVMEKLQQAARHGISQHNQIQIPHHQNHCLHEEMFL